MDKAPAVVVINPEGVSVVLSGLTTTGLQRCVGYLASGPFWENPFAVRANKSELPRKTIGEYKHTPHF